jgi:hypothetical protein
MQSINEATGWLHALDAQIELAEHEPGRVAGDWLRAYGLTPTGGVVR